MENPDIDNQEVTKSFNKAELHQKLAKARKNILLQSFAMLSLACILHFYPDNVKNFLGMKDSDIFWQFKIPLVVVGIGMPIWAFFILKVKD